MPCVTIFGCPAQPHRPHLGPRIRAARGWKLPSRSSSPNAYQRLEPHQVVLTLSLNTMCNGEFNASRNSQSWKDPWELSNLIPSLCRWRHFPNQKNSSFQGHPARQQQGDVYLPSPARPTLQPYFSSQSEPCCFLSPCLCSPCPRSRSALCTVSPTCRGKHTVFQGPTPAFSLPQSPV